MTQTATSCASARAEREDRAQPERDGEAWRLLDSISDHAIFALDPAGHITTWNRGAERLLGYAQEEIVGEHVGRLHLGQEVAEGGVAEALEQALLHGRHAEEGLRVRADGSTFWAQVVLNPLRDEAGGTCGFAAVLRDVSERKRREEALHRLADAGIALRARDEFLSLASHELRTPLTALRLHLQTLARSARRKPEEAVASLPARAAKLEQHVDRMSSLIDTLLDVARIASGHLRLDLAPVSLGPMVAGLVERRRAVLPEPGRLRLSVGGVVLGRCDGARIEQVVASLIDNALKYGGDEPVEVAVARADDRAVLVVRDRGIGIAAEDHARIFERFGRAAPVSQYGGFGFGLWAAREIVKAHGGTIRVHSQHGRGSTFVVELPLASAA
ncbi:PAS domain-containing sensor histidine kinase [Anaeromyxobacter diazotrophicus]|nr:PAS domain-containing sensor histidine kinase [Anaeromyxobacter diazotrophicus]